MDPLFIIGSPRSGTTLLLDLMGAHRDLAWVSMQLNSRPDNLLIAQKNRIYNYALSGLLYSLKKRAVEQPFLVRVQRRRLPFPVEPWRFWRYYLAMFRRERVDPTQARPQTADDVQDGEAETTRQVVEQICAYQNRPIFLSKYTDWPRIAYLSAIWPGARFVHIVREGHAAAFSIWNKTNANWRTWEERDYWSAAWPADWKATFENDHYDALGLSAYLWKFFVKSIREEAAPLPPGRYMEIQYGDLIHTPRETLRFIMDFADLKTSRYSWGYLKHITLRDQNTKWRDNLSADECLMLDEIIHGEA